MVDSRARQGRVQQPLGAGTDALLGLAQDLGSVWGDLRGSLQKITEAASRAVGCERVSVWLYDEGRTAIQCEDLFERSTGEHDCGAVLPRTDVPRYFEALEDERVLAVHDARRDRRTDAFHDDYLVPNDIYSMLDAPIRRGGVTVGVICHEHTGSERTWTDAEELLAGSFADFASLVLEASAAPTGLAQATDPRSYTPKHLVDRILTQKTAIEGERKHVTVLFADLADSTALAERLGDPEEMHQLLDRAFQLMLEEIHGVEGTINQFTGDGVMALFGAPLALEDGPQRAISAALEIQRALAPLDAEVQEAHGGRFRMRIGIHTGPVVVGRIGDDLRMDYTAVGDTTNLAARLEEMAAPGSVVVSEAVQRLVEGYFDVRPLAPAQVKGKAGPIQAYEVVAAHQVAGRIDVASGSAGGLTDYVERERELDALMAAHEQAKAGHGQVAFVVGEAGLGKSRLLHEFRRRLGTEQHIWIEGRCASYAQSTPFHAIADSVRRLHRIDDRDDESRAQAKLVAREDLMGDEFAWTLPYLRVLLSLPSGDAEVDALDAMSRRAEMCRALHARMLRIAEQMPVVLVMEDLH